MTNQPETQTKQMHAVLPAKTQQPNNPKDFLVKTLVTFMVLNKQGKEERKKEEVIFEIDKASAEMPWYVLRNYLVPRYLVANYGPKEVGWQWIYEIKIEKMINRDDPDDITDIPMRIMTREQLKLYCKKWELSVPVDEFFSTAKAREMVALREEDPKGYEKHLAEYRAGKQRTYPQLDSVRADMDQSLKHGALPTVDKAEWDKIDTKPKSTGPKTNTKNVNPLADPFKEV